MIRYILAATLLTAIGCQKERVVPEISTRNKTEKFQLIQSDLIRVDSYELVAKYSFNEETQELIVSIKSAVSDRTIGMIRYIAIAADTWQLVDIESGPCFCDPQCDAYNESLCNWWKCVDNTLSDNGAEITLGSALCPECGAVIVSYVLFACAQPGAPTGGF
jgi:hypothetical protein